MACTIIFLLCCGPAWAGYDSREALRAEYDAFAGAPYPEPYLETPGTGGDYTLGSLTEEALGRALSEVNFLRGLCGLPPVALSEESCLLCQYGAVLLAAGGRLSHQPEQPFDMRDEYYQEGLRAAGGSNLARFNWFAPDILHQAILRFALDDGRENRLALGHRRWLLYPRLGDVGFGLAGDAAGYSYVLMYVMDQAAGPVEYDYVAWPASGYFPAEYLTADMSWSLSLNPARYDLAAPLPRITLTEEVSGVAFRFDESTPEDSYRLALGRFGDGPALVFIPDLSAFEAVENGYEQNQVWRVEVEGLVSAAGEALPTLTYEVRIAALSPIDPAAVELAFTELSLRPGEEFGLSASVIPRWADDLSVRYESSDPEIATVDESGRITALAPGQAVITASSVNGREDKATVTVTEE